MNKTNAVLLGSTGQSIMWEEKIAAIRREARSIALSTDTLVWLKTGPAALARIDLQRSAEELRDAAARLDELAGKHQRFLAAAE